MMATTKERQFGPIEFHEPSNRRDIHRLLQAVHYMLNPVGRIVLPDQDRTVANSRIRLLESLAVELLGEDVSFEEYT